jgi:hypothetical protein
MSLHLLVNSITFGPKTAARGDRTPDLPLTKRLPCHLAIAALQVTEFTMEKVWRSRVSIPVPADCEPTALPSELHPQPCGLQKRGLGRVVKAHA